MKTNKMDKLESVDKYLAGLLPQERELLEDIRKVVRATAPEAVEKMGYGMPGFYYLGHPLVYYACFKDHCSFFAANPEIQAQFKKELKGYKTAKGTIQFTIDKPLPAELVKKIVQARMKENEEKKRKY